jgi:hypothetical protein
MSQIKSPLEIYRLLPRTNCRQCDLPTCFAFATAVLKGERRLADCPPLGRDTGKRPAVKISTLPPMDRVRAGIIDALRKEVAAIDLASSAGRLGARFREGKLALSCLGKDFLVDRSGNVASECHTHAGLVIPLLSYIVHSRGTDISGQWTPFRELRNGAQRGPLFSQRGEKPLRRLADSRRDLFRDIISIFGGERSATTYSSDTAVILYPLPKVPVLFCYWEPEGDMESELKIFFDATAEDHLPIESLFELGVGLVMMFERIALTHGYQGGAS